MLRPAPRLIALLAAGALALAACAGTAGSPALPTANPSAAITPSGSASPASPTASSGSSAAASAGASPVAVPSGCPTSQPAAMPAGQTATVTIATAKGSISIKVEGSLGSNAAGNFVALARCGYYDGVVFHRLVPGFVIQGGDGQYGREPNIDQAHVGQGGPGYAFADDPVTGSYTRGTVAMANAGPNTNGSQFFIVLADAGLPPSYSIFGHVTAGMDVVDAIAAMPNSGGQENLATQPVAMTKVTVGTP
ncbi:MAG TPA: peptidylprolyl isomerase [Candidatus Limnocylindrales bacterium]